MPPRLPPAQVYRTLEVARILGVTPRRVRSMVQAGLSRPGRRGRWFEFSFQDLVLLRAAQGLAHAGVSARRIKRSLGELTRQLPADRPLSGIRIYAEGPRVVVREGSRAWQPDSGQQVFVFDVDDLAHKTRTLVPAPRRSDRKAAARQESATEWFDRGVALESTDPRAARAAYQQAIEIDPTLSDAHVNLGRLLHNLGDLDSALRHYRQALAEVPDDPVVHFNLAGVLEDGKDTAAALAHYHRAIELDPNFADAHFNLGRLLEVLGRREQALRHLLAYRRLTGKK